MHIKKEKLEWDNRCSGSESSMTREQENTQKMAFGKQRRQMVKRQMKGRYWYEKDIEGVDRFCKRQDGNRRVSSGTRKLRRNCNIKLVYWRKGLEKTSLNIGTREEEK